MVVKKQEVFQKLGSSDRETVINDLVASSELLMVKGDFSDNPSFLIPAHIENDFVLICKLSSEGHPIPITFVGDELQKVVITFTLLIAVPAFGINQSLTVQLPETSTLAANVPMVLPVLTMP